MKVSPSDTFLYDAKTSLEMDTLFNNITVYNQMNIGLRAIRFTEIIELGRVFIPTVTYHQNDTDIINQYVAIVEG